MLATAHQDLAAQFKEVASYAGALVGETEWALIQAKPAVGDASVRAHATETEGQGKKGKESLRNVRWATVSLTWQTIKDI